MTVFPATTLRISGTGQTGRAFFLTTAQLDEIDVEALGRQFTERFVELDDEERIRLLVAALAAPRIVVETYPGENEPVAYYGYVRAPRVSRAALFACVLAPDALVEYLLSFPPHIVLETSTFQAIGGEASAPALMAGVESWIRRVWPGAIVPEIEILNPPRGAE